MKELSLSDDILQKLRARMGQDMDVSNIAVFEAVAINTKPVTKHGSIYNGSVFTSGSLYEMADYLNNRDGGIPLQLMHRTSELPNGKLFYAQVLSNELRVLFYLNRSQEDLVTKLNTGVIDEVSIGALPKHLRCSECSWDYFGPEADLMNFWDQTCANDHTIGKDGVHAIFDGLDTWMETSLVGTGAANGPKIVGPSKALLESQSFQQLAANHGEGLRMKMFFGSATTTKEKSEMADKDAENKKGSELTVLLSELTDARVELKTSVAKVTTLEASVSERDEKIATLTSEVETLKAELAQLSDGDVATLTASNKILKDCVTDLAKRSLVASGQDADELPEDAEDLVKLLGETQSKLSAVIPVGGASLGAGKPEEKPTNPKALDAFRTVE